MDYKHILKNFMIELETLPENDVGFYEIWNFRKFILDIEKNYNQLELNDKKLFYSLLNILRYKLENITFDNDPLVENEVKFLLNLTNKDIQKLVA